MLHNFFQKKLAFRRKMCESAPSCIGLDVKIVQ
jgi:hypothetical protein